MEALHQLPTTDLRMLASSLRSGRTGLPCSEITLRRTGLADPGGVTAVLNRLHAEGMTAPSLGLMLEAMAEARRREQAARQSTELVWTGPEAAGVANRATDVVVRELFSNAVTEVIVAGFAVHRGREVFQALADRMQELPTLKVRMYLDVRRAWNDTTAASELVWKFRTEFLTRDWPGGRLPEIYYDPRSLSEDREKRSVLHAKCVVADRQSALVTSANFTEAAQVRNIELGVLIRSDRVAGEIARHFDSLAVAGILTPLPG